MAFLAGGRFPSMANNKIPHTWQRADLHSFTARTLFRNSSPFPPPSCERSLIMRPGQKEQQAKSEVEEQWATLSRHQAETCTDRQSWCWLRWAGNRYMSEKWLKQTCFISACRHTFDYTMPTESWERWFGVSRITATPINDHMERKRKKRGHLRD